MATANQRFSTVGPTYVNREVHKDNIIEIEKKYKATEPQIPVLFAHEPHA